MAPPVVLRLLTLFSVTTTLATPILTELTSIVAAPRPKMVVPDATNARPSAALAAMLVLLLMACWGWSETAGNSLAGALRAKEQY